MKKFLITIPLLSLLCFGFQNQQIAKELEAIRTADRAWLKAVQNQDIVRVLSFYRDDAKWLLRDAPPMEGKDSIQKSWSGFFAVRGSWIQWEPVMIEVSASGDFGYGAGTYEMRYSDQQGKTVTHKGAYVTIWKKDRDGNWKLALDISN